jgi:hypothetical protein
MDGRSNDVVVNWFTQKPMESDEPEAEGSNDIVIYQ